MSGIRNFFRRLFGREETPPEHFCRKIGNQFYAYRRVQGNSEQIAGPFSTCEQCQRNYPGAECREY